MAIKKYTLLLTCLLACLAGCGGGGGGDNPAPPPGPITGVFMNSPVGGVDYACTDGTSGTTNAAGEFTCTTGDTVTFTLAGHTLGQATASSLITVFDITGATQPTQRQMAGFVNGNMNNVSDVPVHRALNIAMLLQTLDDDGDLTAGINITPADALAFSAATYTLNLDKYSTTVLERVRKLLKQAGLVRKPRSLIATLRYLVQTGTVTTPLYRVTQEVRDINADTIPDEKYTYTWDANGDATLFTEDDNADNVADATYTNTYYANHKLDEQMIVVGGTFDSTSTHTYDADGNLEQDDIDFDDDGTPDKAYYFTHDTYGNLTLCEEDNDLADANVDRIISYTYDADGNLTLEEQDNDADTNVDAVTTYTYDADGNLTLEEQDNDADAVIDTTLTYTYVDGGLTTYRIDKDSDDDGTIDHITVSTFNSDGNLENYELDYDAATNPGVDFADIHTYDSRGNIASTLHTSVSGAPWERTYAYDGDDNRVYSAFDNNADTTIEAIQTWTYTNGNETRFENYTDANGAPNTVITHSYEPANLYPDISSFPVL